MFVFTPIEATDSNMTSTIAEPDQTVGEVEYTAPNPASFYISPFQNVAVARESGVEYIACATSGGSTFRVYNLDGSEYATHSINVAGSVLFMSASIDPVDDSSTGDTFLISTSGYARVDIDGNKTGEVSFSSALSPQFNSRACYDGASIHMLTLVSSTTGTIESVVVGQTTTTTTVIAASEELNRGFAYYDGYFYFRGESGDIHVYDADFEFVRIISMTIESGLDNYSLSLDFDGFVSSERNRSEYGLTQSMSKLDYDFLYKKKFDTGDRYIDSSTHKLYEAATRTDDNPAVGVDLIPPTWVEISATNKYRMFDSVGSTQSTDDENLVVALTPGSLVTSLACFNLDDTETVNITMVDPSAGEVYNKDIQLRDASQIFSWYDYFFEDISSVSQFIINDLPPYKSATITVTFMSSNPKVGVLAVGRQIELGTSEYGSSLALRDWSTVETDTFGNTTIIKRDTSKQVEFLAYTETNRANYVFDRLADTTGIPSVWYGSGEENDSTLVFGYYSDSSIVLSNPSTTKFTLSIEGLT